MVIISPDLVMLGAAGEVYGDLPLGVRYVIALVLAPLVIAVASASDLLRRTYGKKKEYGLLLTFGAALVLRRRSA